MSESEPWRSGLSDDSELPPEIDITIPSVARAYDYALGGKNHFAVDRMAADASNAVFPGALDLARDNRKFLRRTVQYLVADAGITQILDVGSGLPTAGNVHEVAHKIDPSVRVVYIDIDPIVLAHGRALLANNNTTAVIIGDAADPKSIMEDPTVRDFIDLDRPLAVLLSGILHHLSDEQTPTQVAHYFSELMPSGSYLMASNFLDDDDPLAKEAETAIVRNFGTGWFRSWTEQESYFEGLELVEPGLTYANDWRPDSSTTKNSPWHTYLAGAVGRKP
ncbi:SAM-dependent methyltransferase [Pseudonocardia sp. TRM90224]|uniref:SAM-dependent methyltransferase n=1 Tax=Pseudonocardia sp. TRM90224 TaxID=2812678 RepID=UPI0027E18666|nr:SAM-dependent methyltransferase [Pseudonocardia sp. TRM90224]